MRATLVDVSKHQGNINGEKIAEAGFCGIVARCTLGWGYIDPQYSRNLAQAVANNLIFGAYHVIWPRNKAVLKEVDWFLQNLGSQVDLVVCDIEVHAEQNVLGYAEEWLTEVEKHLGQRPIIYTGSWFWNQLPSPAGWEKDYSLWEAEYLSVPPGQMKWDPSQAPQEKDPTSLGRGWDTWTFWQWTSSGKPIGVQSESLDYNVFNGTEDQLREWLKSPITHKVEVDIPKEAEIIEFTLKRI